jgi:DNA-binding response OmpR family regulator
MPAKILVVEDDPAILRGLAMNLEVEGYELLTARDGDEGVRMWKRDRPDMVLLDLMLPRRSGLEVLRAIRAEDRDIPILILSAKGEEADKVLGLSLGADDYVTKPFGLAELLARIRAGLRRGRQAQSAAPALAFGDVEIDRASRRVTRKGAEVEMTAKEFDLLLHLISHPGRVHSREQIMQSVWGPDHFGTPRTVDNFVARLRAKLEDDPENPRFFQTVRGVGYRFDL